MLTVHAYVVLPISTTETKNEKKKSVGAPQVKDSGVIDHGMEEDSHYDEPDDMDDGSHYDKSDDDEPDDDEPDDDEHVGF